MAEGQLDARSVAVDFNDRAELPRRLGRAINRACPGWLADQREDLLQAALLRVLEYEKKRELRRQLSTSFLWRVAFSAMVDEIRRIRRRPEGALASEGIDRELPASSPGPEEAMARRELGDALQQCLDRLDSARRLAVGLHLLGHPLQEIPGLAAWTPNRARNLLYRGLANLRRCLTDKGFAP